VILRGGTVLDGAGGPPRVADVAIVGNRIASVGPASGVRAGREIDATGLAVAPGFVDVHSHADLILLGDRTTQEALLGARIAQGVTTIVVGNCGLGVAPTRGDGAELLAAINGWMTPEGVAAGELSVAEYLGRLEEQGVALNVGMLAPHGPVRASVMGLGPGAPSDAQLESMRRAVDDALAQGALGLSVGLIYPPGMYSATDELVELARVVAARDRLFSAHVRGSSETLLEATRELIEVAVSSGARVHHSHLEAVGRSFWPDIERVLALEDAARAAGARLSHDVFPYTRAATMMSAIFPPWALEGGMPALLERLADDVTRRRLRRELEERVPEWPPWQPSGWPHNLVGAVGWDGILVASVPPHAPAALVGRRLSEIGAATDRHPLEAVADLMVSAEGRVGQLVDEVSGREGEIDLWLPILSHPAAAVISDAEDYGRGRPHPAHAGAFVRALRLNRERSLMSPGELVRRMTSHPASLMGLADHGVIRPGAYADLVAFDPEQVADRATWDEPRRRAAGVAWVLIDGRIVVGDGRYRGGLHGRVLRAA
jgi:N-acyl-D-aspartate/D-glutamate deacylase